MSLKSCLCIGGKDKKKNVEKEQLITMDGNRYFPSSFASKEYLEQQDRKRRSSLRKSSQGKDKKQKKKRTNEVGIDEAAAQ